MKFKAGDKVRFVKYKGGAIASYKLGDIVVIKKYSHGDQDPLYEVVDSKGWLFYESSLELVVESVVKKVKDSSWGF